VLVGKKWGYIDRNGKIVINARYSVGYDPKQHRFSEGLALVYLKEKCRYIDKTGKVAITLACSDAERFDGGIASVRTEEEKAERRGYINKQGKYIWGPVAYKYRTMEEISSRTEKQAKEEEVLTPLTDEEKALNPKNLIWRQPDFVADLNFFIGEGFGGHGGAYRLVRKGNRYRQESEFWVYVGEDDKSSVQLFPITRSYDDFKPVRSGSIDSIPINPRALALEKDVTFTALGTRTVDGHYCLKVEAVRQSKPDTRYYFYIARDLKNLVIVAQVITPRRGGVQRLSNISFNVYDSLVQIPADYKTKEHDRWTKVEGARVSYKGRVVKEASVFRAPEGQLFLRVNDWTYLVRPKEGTVETAFQGLLVTRSGEYVWTTTENEAYSSIGYRNPRPPQEWESKRDRGVIVKPNSVTFRSTSYELDKAMIEALVVAQELVVSGRCLGVNYFSQTRSRR
jgi:WG containing repeat